MRIEQRLRGALFVVAGREEEPFRGEGGVRWTGVQAEAGFPLELAATPCSPLRRRRRGSMQDLWAAREGVSKLVPRVARVGLDVRHAGRAAQQRRPQSRHAARAASPHAHAQAQLQGMRARA
eukprot:13678270-Alexandrium_andersonii.AAC.1